VTQTPLSAYRRITIKIGSALLVDKSGKLRAEWLAQLAEDIAALKAEACLAFPR
jgi:glutamate 5-kinase